MDSFFVEKEDLLKNIILPLSNFSVESFTLTVEADNLYTIAKKGNNDFFFGTTDIKIPGFTGLLRFSNLVILKKAIEQLKSDLIKINVSSNFITASDENDYAFKIFRIINDANDPLKKVNKKFFTEAALKNTIVLNKKQNSELSALNSLALETQKLYIEDDGDFVKFSFTDREKPYANEFFKKFKKSECGEPGVFDPIKISSEFLTWITGRNTTDVTISQFQAIKGGILVQVDKKYYSISQLVK